MRHCTVLFPRTLRLRTIALFSTSPDGADAASARGWGHFKLRGRSSEQDIYDNNSDGLQEWESDKSHESVRETDASFEGELDCP